jgi:hypothetical protein
MSGNTLGARTWTDGKRDAPMMPEPPTVAVCGTCGEPYWLAEAEELGHIGSGWGEDDDEGGDPAWASAPRVQEPSEAGYYAALASGLAKDPEQEKTLRILAMWKRNDPLRDAPQDVGPGLSAAARQNLEALANLLDGDADDERLMRAEALRELGDFDAAKQVLETVESSDYAWVVERFRELCDERDSVVRELTADA